MPIESTDTSASKTLEGPETPDPGATESSDALTSSAPVASDETTPLTESRSAQISVIGDFQKPILSRLKELTPDNIPEGICHGLVSMIAIPFLAKHPGALGLVINVLKTLQTLPTKEDRANYDSIVKLIHHLQQYPTAEHRACVQQHTAKHTPDTSVDHKPNDPVEYPPDAHQTGPARLNAFEQQEFLLIKSMYPTMGTDELYPEINSLLNSRLENIWTESLTASDSKASDSEAPSREANSDSLISCLNSIESSNLYFSGHHLGYAQDQKDQWNTFLRALPRPSVVTVSTLEHTIGFYLADGGQLFFVDANRGFFECQATDRLTDQIDLTIRTIIPKGAQCPTLFGVRLAVFSPDGQILENTNTFKTTLNITPVHPISRGFSYFYMVLADPSLQNKENIEACFNHRLLHEELSRINLYLHAKRCGSLDFLLTSLFNYYEFRSTDFETLHTDIIHHLKHDRTILNDCLDIFLLAAQSTIRLKQIKENIISYYLHQHTLTNPLSGHGAAGRERSERFSNLIVHQITLLTTQLRSTPSDAIAMKTLLDQIRCTVTTHFNTHIRNSSRQSKSLESYVTESVFALQTDILAGLSNNSTQDRSGSPERLASKAIGAPNSTPWATLCGQKDTRAPLDTSELGEDLLPSV